MRTIRESSDSYGLTAAPPPGPVAFYPLNYFIDSVNGDDLNDGLSPYTAWKTEAFAVAALLPIMQPKILNHIGAVNYLYNSAACGLNLPSLTTFRQQFENFGYLSVIGMTAAGPFSLINGSYILENATFTNSANILADQIQIKENVLFQSGVFCIECNSMQAQQADIFAACLVINQGNGIVKIKRGLSLNNAAGNVAALLNFSYGSIDFSCDYISTPNNLNAWMKLNAIKAEISIGDISEYGYIDATNISENSTISAHVNLIGSGSGSHWMRLGLSDPTKTLDCTAYLGGPSVKNSGALTRFIDLDTLVNVTKKIIYTGLPGAAEAYFRLAIPETLNEIIGIDFDFLKYSLLRIAVNVADISGTATDKYLKIGFNGDFSAAAVQKWGTNRNSSNTTITAYSSLETSIIRMAGNSPLYAKASCIIEGDASPEHVAAQRVFNLLADWSAGAGARLMVQGTLLWTNTSDGLSRLEFQPDNSFMRGTIEIWARSKDNEISRY